MYKAPEMYFDNRKQKGDDGSCLRFNTESTGYLFNNSANGDKMISQQQVEQSLQNQVNSFYNSINTSQPKELTSDTYKLPSYNSDTQCKSNKIQYKTGCNGSSERTHPSTIFTMDKTINRTDNDDLNDSYISDSETTDSEFSNLSGLSDLSGQEWKPTTKSLTWVQKQIHSGANPREILSQILSNGATIASNLNDMSLWRILANMLSEPPRRQKLRHINTIDDVVQLLKTSKNIIVLTGAGVSVSCGIPDFRSSDGIYSRLAKDFPDLPDPQAMFDINYFTRDPRPFYKFAREIYPGQFTPSPCHRFIKLLEKKQKLLRNYTQNIDTLEQVAGIQSVIECHGSFATASCTKCKYKTTADVIRNDIFAQRIPLCPKCHPNPTSSVYNNLSTLNTEKAFAIQTETTNGNTPISTLPITSYCELVQSGIMKPDIVFFGEGLPDAFHTAMASDKDKCDLLIVIGSSLKVRPVALIPSSIPSTIPQILINRERLNHLEFDVELLGDSDVIINQLCHLLGEDWTEICWDSNILVESKQLKMNPLIPRNVHPSVIDTDSQSNKSAITTNSSNGVFCDSGFESSSSLHGPHIVEKNKEYHINNEQHEDNKSCNNKTNSLTTVQKNSPMSNLLECSNYEGDFKGFHKDTSNLRHLSVDSLKDSGICELATSTDYKTSHIDEDEADDEEEYNDNGKMSNITPARYACLQKSTGYSIAERLYENTYYHHTASSSYVFPGAQVYWSSDSEDEDIEDDDEDEDDDNEDEYERNQNLDEDRPPDDCKLTTQSRDDSENESDDDSPPNKRRREFPFSEI